MQNQDEASRQLTGNADTGRAARLPSNISKRTLIAAGLILLVIPAVIALGMVVLEDRKYYFVSLLIIICAMVPFVMIFEHRRPQAREIVIIAMLAALAVAGRSVAFMLPGFKPVIALVIITGVCFGGESGFLVGAITAFVSNFFFGQGPWTPWQMFCFGIIG
ncbi:MAG: metal ion transporter rane-spanning subunit, partial [Firmicutes bacterium]|nr:metal ion transporter rane-spanning subunit [Bacillota bacterium]